jgi:hypothetical protein
VSPPSESGVDTKDQSSVEATLRVGVSRQVPPLRGPSDTLGRLKHGAFGLSLD